MKKFLLTILVALSIVLIPNVSAKINVPEKTDHEKVKVYLFWSSTCKNCHNLISYFGDKYDAYEDYFEIVTYQVNTDKANSELSNAIAEDVKEDPGYIPLVIIGNTYHVLGWQDSLGETIINEALKAYQDENYTDIVAKKIEDKQLTVTEKTFKDACSVAGITFKGSKESKTDGIVIGIVFGVLILGFAGLIVLSRKK